MLKKHFWIKGKCPSKSKKQTNKQKTHEISRVQKGLVMFNCRTHILHFIFLFKEEGQRHRADMGESLPLAREDPVEGHSQGRVDHHTSSSGTAPKGPQIFLHRGPQISLSGAIGLRLRMMDPSYKFTRGPQAHQYSQMMAVLSTDHGHCPEYTPLRYWYPGN